MNVSDTFEPTIEEMMCKISAGYVCEETIVVCYVLQIIPFSCFIVVLLYAPDDIHQNMPGNKLWGVLCYMCLLYSKLQRENNALKKKNQQDVVRFL